MFEWGKNIFCKSPTIHGASYRKLRLLSTGSDDSGIAIDDADFEERDTDHDSEDETDFCGGKLELWQDRRRRQGLRSALFWRCSNEDYDGKRTDFPSSDKNGRFYGFYIHKIVHVRHSEEQKTTNVLLLLQVAGIEPGGRPVSELGDSVWVCIPGGSLRYLGGCIRSLSKLKNTPKALISGQKSTLISIKR